MASKMEVAGVSDIMEDESVSNVLKDLISIYTSRLHHLYWRHPAWFINRTTIEPMYMQPRPLQICVTTNLVTRLLDRKDGPLFLALTRFRYTTMKLKLPREARDLIWAQVWDHDTVEDKLVYMRNTITSGCRTCIKPEDLNCPYHLGVPWFVRPALVGAEMATELVESWYNLAATKYDDLLFAFTAKGVQQIICKDAFQIGREPGQFIRKLEINMDVSNFVPPPVPLEPGQEFWDEIRSAEHRRELITEPLLKIQNRWGFKLTIKVSQNHIRLNLWKEVFDALREPVRVVKEEGTIVKASFIYKGGSYRIDGVLTYDILEAMTQPEEEWKATAEAFFEAQTDIADIHGLYRDEDRPDFDPNSNVYLTQEEINNKMESEMYASMYDNAP